MEEDTLGDLIDRDQFKVIKHKIIFYNLTTETEILVPDLIKLITCGEETFSLQIPQKTCAQGHLLEVYFIPDDAPKKGYSRSILARVPNVAIIKGKIIEIGQDSGHKKFMDVIIRIDSCDENSYKNVIQKYQKRQGELDSILTRFKG